MRRSRALFPLAVAVIAVLALGGTAEAAHAATLVKVNQSEVATFALDKANGVRAKMGLPAFTLNTSLNADAQACADQYAKTADDASAQAAISCSGGVSKTPYYYGGDTEESARPELTYDLTSPTDLNGDPSPIRSRVVSTELDTMGVAVAVTSSTTAKYNMYLVYVFGSSADLPAGTSYTPLTGHTFDGSITIARSVRVGNTLRAKKTGYPAGTSYAYKWYAGSKPVPGATHATLKITKKLVGKHIRVKVTAEKTGYRSQSRVSITSNPVKR